MAVGRGVKAFPTPLPFVFGVDCAGVVAKVGSSVTSPKVGDRIIVYLGFACGGGSGEYVATKGEYAVPAPKNMPLSEAGAIPLAALTAWKYTYILGLTMFLH